MSKILLSQKIQFPLHHKKSSLPSRALKRWKWNNDDVIVQFYLYSFYDVTLTSWVESRLLFAASLTSSSRSGAQNTEKNHGTHKTESHFLETAEMSEQFLAKLKQKRQKQI